MIISVVLISAVLVAVGIAASQKESALIWSLVGGIALGAGCAAVGYKLTLFEITTTGKYYKPNLYLGLVISLIFVARLVSRLSALYLGSGSYSLATSLSPFTMVVFGLSFGYFLVYSILVLIRLGYQSPRMAGV